MQSVEAAATQQRNLPAASIVQQPAMQRALANVVFDTLGRHQALRSLAPRVLPDLQQSKNSF
jgi:hypothetical protein